MDQLPNLLVVLVVLGIGGVTLFKLGFIGKKRLPQLPESGPLPVADLAQYYALREPALAWERVRGWNLNEAVTAPATAPIDHVVLTPRLLDFCSASTGKLELVFNFLVAAIENVTFEPGALPPGTGAPGQGLVTIFTPSGQTRLFATQGFVLTLQKAITQARAAAPTG